MINYYNIIILNYIIIKQKLIILIKNPMINKNKLNLILNRYKYNNYFLKL